MSVNIKLSNGTTVTVSITNFKMTVGELKQAAAGPTNIPANEQRMVFRGKILKDEQVLEEIGLKDGDALHVVKSGASSAPRTTFQSAAPPQQTTPPTQPQTANPYASLFGAQGTGTQPGSGRPGMGMPGMGMPGMGMPGMGMPGMGMPPGGMGMPGMGNDMNAAMQYLRQNPAMFQQGLQQMQQNPQMVEQLMSQHPMFQGMPAEQRQQMLRMYTDPNFGNMVAGMMGAGGGNAAPGTMGGMPNMFGMGQQPQTQNQATPSTSSNPQTTTPQATAPSGDATGTGTAQQQQEAIQNMMGLGFPGMGMGWPGMGMGFPGMGMGFPGMGMGYPGMGMGMPGMGFPGINPQVLQEGMQQMRENPEAVEQMMATHPLYQGMTAEQRRQMLAMYTNPQFQQMVSGMTSGNPPAGGFPNMFGGMPQPQAPTQTPQQQSAPSTATSNESQPPQVNPAPQVNYTPGSGGFSGFQTQQAPTQSSAREDREQYKDQLEQLKNMGFPNEQANLSALQMTNGNIEFAVARLLGE